MLLASGAFVVPLTRNIERKQIMSVTYEWDVEELDGPDAPDVEIVDHHHCDSYAEAVVILGRLGAPGRIVLVRDVGNNLEGLTDRAWAYLVDGKLPDTFTYGADEDSGIRVPKRFHQEIK